MFFFNWLRVEKRYVSVFTLIDSVIHRERWVAMNRSLHADRSHQDFFLIKRNKYWRSVSWRRRSPICLSTRKRRKNVSGWQSAKQPCGLFVLNNECCDELRLILCWFTVTFLNSECSFSAAQSFDSVYGCAWGTWVRACGIDTKPPYNFTDINGPNGCNFVFSFRSSSIAQPSQISEVCIESHEPSVDHHTPV